MNKETLAEKMKREIAENQLEANQRDLENRQILGSGGAKNEPIRVVNVEFPTDAPDVIARRHQKSLKNHPDITVDNDEYVVFTARRHWIGYVGGLIVAILLFIIITSAWIFICFTPNRFNIPAQIKGQLSLIFAPLVLLLVVVSYINYVVYRNNRFVITNERAIQFISNGIMNNKRQVINLKSVEDISFTKVGLLQYLFNFGTVKLSTVGDESTYTFNFAINPSAQAEFLGDIVEAARENQMISEELISLGEKLSS